MLNFLDSLCGCFSPEIKKNIIDYLSSSKLNQNVIEEEKKNEEMEAPEQSIYKQLKTKSYYFMKLQEDQEEQEHKEKSNPEKEAVNILEPNYYPEEEMSLDELYKNKINVLRHILSSEIGVEYSKIFDSQDDIDLRIYCKPEIYLNKRFNSYRFGFKLPTHKHQHVTPKNYLDINMEGERFNVHEPLLMSRERTAVTESGLEVCHRKYKKILVINQHQFNTAEKSQVIEEEGIEAVYYTVFSVKKEVKKVSDCSQGWINLAGLRIAIHKQAEDVSGTSLHEDEEEVRIEGYINCELQISVNANMLRQPVAKEIRVYVQKLICSLSKSDAI